MTFGQSRYFDQQLFMTERAFQIFISAGLEPFHQSHVFFSDRADQEDGNCRSLRILLQPPAKLQPVHSRHDDVTDDDVHADGSGHFQCPARVGGEKCAVAFRFKQISE
jgi:hypothetical protein